MEVSRERSHVTFAPKDADKIVSQPLVVCSGCRDTGCVFDRRLRGRCCVRRRAGMH